MNEPPVFQAAQASGLNTYAARGSADQPFRLENALLRPGGWACAPKPELVSTLVNKIVWRGQYHDYYKEMPGGKVVLRSDIDGGDVAGLNTLDNAVRLAPNLIALPGSYLVGTTFFNIAQPPKIVFWDGNGLPPFGPYYTFDFNGSSGMYDIQYRLTAIHGPDTPGVPDHSTGVIEFTTNRKVSFHNLKHPYLLISKMAGEMDWANSKILSPNSQSDADLNTAIRG